MQAAINSADAPCAYVSMGFANFLADSHHDSLPPDHGAEAEGERDRDFDPVRDEFGHGIQIRAILPDIVGEGGVTYDLVLR